MCMAGQRSRLVCVQGLGAGGGDLQSLLEGDSKLSVEHRRPRQPQMWEPHSVWRRLRLTMSDTNRHAPFARLCSGPNISLSVLKPHFLEILLESHIVMIRVRNHERPRIRLLTERGSSLVDVSFVFLGEQWLETQRQWDELQTLALAHRLSGTFKYIYI